MFVECCECPYGHYIIFITLLFIDMYALRAKVCYGFTASKRPTFAPYLVRQDLHINRKTSRHTQVYPGGVTCCITLPHGMGTSYKFAPAKAKVCYGFIASKRPTFAPYLVRQDLHINRKTPSKTNLPRRGYMWFPS
jgi:hypothetical protein